MGPKPMQLVFVHGGKQGSWAWEETLAALTLQAPGIPPPILLDVPGCGAKRERDTTALDLSAVVDELVGDLAHIERFILVGHSQAGTLLPRLAAARAEAVDHIVYVACSAPREGETIGQMLARIAPPAMTADVPLHERFASMFCNDMTAEATADFLAKLGKDDWPAACATLDTNWSYRPAAHFPSTYVMALRDQILPAKAQEEFAERLGVDNIQRIDSGHQVQQTRPHALAEILLEVNCGRL